MVNTCSVCWWTPFTDEPEDHWIVLLNSGDGALSTLLLLNALSTKKYLLVGKFSIVYVVLDASAIVTDCE